MNQQRWFFMLGVLACQGAVPDADGDLEEVAPSDIADEIPVSDDVRWPSAAPASAGETALEGHHESIAPRARAAALDRRLPRVGERGVSPRPAEHLTLPVGEECGIEAADGTDISCEAGSYCVRAAPGELARCLPFPRVRPSGG